MADISQLQINGVTYDICDATARDNYLPLEGGTISGVLNLNSTTHHSHNIAFNDPVLTKDTAVSTQTTGIGTYLRDSEGNWISRVVPRFRIDGGEGLLIESQRSVNDTSRYNSLGLYILSDGTRQVAMNDPAAWRTALGLETPTTTQTRADVITAASGANVTAVAAAKYGKVVQLAVAFNFSADVSVPATGNITNINIGTVLSAWRPIFNVNLIAIDYNGFASLDTDGLLKLCSIEGTGVARTLAAGTSLAVRGTYIIP